jgi:acylphosphatase
VVTGRVQGVFFRASARDEGRRLGVKGWVRNVADGGVELIIEGDKFAVGKMLQWCTHGPPGAEVTDMATKWEAPENKWDSFNITW